MTEHSKAEPLKQAQPAAQAQDSTASRPVKATQSAQEGQPPASTNPDHANPTVAHSDQPEQDGTVAATEAEKGGSSD